MVSPEFTTASKSVYKLNPEERNCYMSQEKALNFFKVYTQNNCKVECFTNLTVYNCGCVPFYNPRKFLKLKAMKILDFECIFLGESSTRICGYGKSHCVAETRGK